MTTKNELNARLATPLTASKLKKTSLADLQAMVEAQAAKPTRPETGHVYCEPCADIVDLKPIRAGTKRAILAEALAKGATIEQLCDATGWNRSTVQSAFRTDLMKMGYGVHRDAKGTYRLDMPKKARRPAIRAAGETAEQVLVAACR